jgi:alkylated DNA nucleotide flippase Atl1
MNKQSVLLFSLGSTKEGSPKAVSPASYQKMGAMEVQDIERWIKEEPNLLGDEFLVVASQFMQWDKTNDRLDLLVLDRRGKLGVVEIKRDQSGSAQDLQAIRYAAYASTLSLDQVVELFRDYIAREEKENLSEAEARERLADFAVEGDIDGIDKDDQPRMILVAGAFQPGVTGTATWLRRSFDMDISCVQVQPYELQGEIVLTSTTIIPVPEAAEFEVKVQEKKAKAKAKDSKPLDLEVAVQFIEAIPEGRWSSYGDVAVAAGSPKGAMALGTWLSNNGESISTVYRVLNFRGEVSEGFKATGPGLPPDPEAVRKQLEVEGIPFDQDGRADKKRRWTADDWDAKATEIKNPSLEPPSH